MPTRRDCLLGASALGLLSAGGWTWARRGPVSNTPPSLEPVRPTPGFHAGFNHAHLHRRDIGYGSEASRLQLRRLRALGVTHVALTPFGYTSDLEGVTIRFGSDLDATLTDDALRREADSARAEGLAVCMKPHIWSRAFWTSGMSRQDIRPRKTDGGWAAWFEQYAAFAEHYARLSEEMGAALMVVGLEYLQATQQHPQGWTMVAEACRAVFGGKLSYAANWWKEVEAMPDWQVFDFIGVNAYYPLSEEADPSTAQLVAGWAEPLKTLQALSVKHDRPVLFLEAGYRAVRGAAARPWEQSGGGGHDPMLQARAYEALLSAIAGERWVEGVYWWKWFTDAASRERDDYCPMGMPAEGVISRWWGGG
ncbi:MAG: hypothetical protein P8R54_22985 [Myxococcota bacterium]|nr:hypothetical protein [Myxococcota bacterium]